MDITSEHYLTPYQLIKKYPTSPFTHTDLGRLLRADLLEGICTKRVTYIDERSFIKLLEFRNELLAQKMIVVSNVKG